MSHVPALPPYLKGEPAHSGFAVKSFGLWAREAGIQRGDVIVSIAGRPIRDASDLTQCVAGHGAGEWVSVRLHRAAKPMELTVELPGGASRRSADGFPTFFEHDIPLRRSGCGGPVVDLDGNFVGITVFAGEYGCMAIPIAYICRLFEELKSGGSTDAWDKPRGVQ